MAERATESTRSARSVLWRHRDFLKLWSAQTVSQAGTQISLLAVPLIAAVTLDVSPVQMGILGAMQTLPFLLFGLLAGVFVDRRRRRPILITTDLARAALFAIIPLAWWGGWLSYWLLVFVSFGAGVMTVLFAVSYQSYLPALISRKHLIDGNSKLESSRAGAQMIGPGLAGILIELITAPAAMIVDACSFLVSGLLLSSILTREPDPEPVEAGRSIRSDIVEGLSYIFRHPLLRPIAACTATSNFMSGIEIAVIILFATRTLDLDAGLIGIIFAGGGIGYLLGATVAGRIGQSIGVGWTIIGGIGLTGLGMLFFPLAGGPPLVATGILIVGMTIGGVGGALYNITQVSLRQAITPDRILGRMSATMSFVVRGAIPLGSLVGGVLAEWIGLRATMGVVALGALAAILWPLFSSVRDVVEYPEDEVNLPTDAPVSQPFD